VGSYRTLTEAQAEQFLEKGYVVIENAFSREAAQTWTDLAYKRLGYDPEDSSTWKEPYLHLPTMNRALVKDFAPKAYDAICDLMGEDRIDPTRVVWGDGFIINFTLGADQPWIPPSAAAPGWHVDGDFFKRFLDSPEQGLLTIIIWSDILPQGGGTFGATDSVAHVARFLANHPEGVDPNAFGPLVQQCKEFVEFTGQTGDVVLMHPFMIHASSFNPSGRARFITNPPVSFTAPMNFNRAHWDEHSLVEKAVLRGLGVEQYDFRPTAPREAIVPERVRRQQKMLEEQQERLGKSQT
jgi:hypothetical protein